MAALTTELLRRILDDPQAMADWNRRENYASLCRRRAHNEPPALFASLAAAFDNVSAPADLESIADAAEAEDRTRLRARLDAIARRV